MSVGPHEGARIAVKVTASGDHRPPSHISKTVLSTVHVGGAQGAFDVSRPRHARLMDENERLIMAGCQRFRLHVFCFEREHQEFGQLMVATGW